MDGEEKSLDAILTESLGASYDAAEATPEPVDAGQGDTGKTDAAPVTGQQRDDHGRFKTNTGEAAVETAPAAPNTDQGQTQAAAPGTDPASAPPASWSAAEKAIWPTLPPDVRATIARREADFAKGIEQKARGYEALDQVLAPRRVGLAAEYGSVENAVSTLFKLSDFAAQDKPGFVKWFCQAHGLDPQQIFAGAPADGVAPQPGQDGQPAASPELAAVRAELESLKNDMVRAVQAPVIAKAQTELQKFEAEAATKSPHYANPQVKSEMARVLASSQSDLTFEQAYDRVVWSMPELRQQLLDTERKTAVEAQSKAAADAAKKARHSAGPQLRAAGTPGEVRAVAHTIDQTLSEVYDRSQGVA